MARRLPRPGGDDVSLDRAVHLGSDQGAHKPSETWRGLRGALTVFFDDLARINDDPDHSVGEHREIITGYSAAGRLLLVSFTERADDIVRIINARTADPDERRDYEERDI